MTDRKIGPRGLDALLQSYGAAYARCLARVSEDDLDRMRGIRDVIWDALAFGNDANDAVLVVDEPK